MSIIICIIIHQSIKGCWSDGIIDIISPNFLRIGFTELKTFYTFLKYAHELRNIQVKSVS